MSSFFLILSLLSLLGVVLILLTGIFAMAKGGSFNEKYSNRLMQLRVGLQALTILFLALAYMTTSH